MTAKHQHKHKQRPDVDAQVTCYRGGIWPTEDGGQNPAAAGGVLIIEECACGAIRHTNSNGNHQEVGCWYRPE